jgi:peptidoglycan/xylan/chitin deacetylase (PgdA/CDA1 family)
VADAEDLTRAKWELRVAENNGADLVIAPYRPEILRIAIRRAQEEPAYDIQLNQRGLKARAKHRYRVSFDARADHPRSIFLGFSRAHEPWTGLGLYKRIDLTSEWQMFHQEFVASASDDNARIHLDVGGSATPVEFSSMILRDLSDRKIVTPDVALKVPRRFNFHRVPRRFRRWFSRDAVVLVYHRVGESQRDPFALCVAEHRFAEHLEVLREYRCMPLQGLVHRHEDGKHPRRAVVITFDDGYADNLHHAKPLLDRYGIPATVFVTTGYIGSDREFWWDELERLLFEPEAVPQTLLLTISGETQDWQIDGVHDSKNDYKRDCSRQEPHGNPNSRHSLYHSLWRLLRPLPDGERRAVMEHIRQWAGAEPVVRPTHRPLSPEEVRGLEQGSLIEVGAHTVTHPLLSLQPLLLQEEEIKTSKTHLETILGHRIVSFSYPFGDYTQDTVASIRDAGFNCACSIVPNVVRRDTDILQLPRVEVQNWDGEEFARRLEDCFA